jgi:hypothetical protein
MNIMLIKLSKDKACHVCAENAATLNQSAPEQHADCAFANGRS